METVAQIVEASKTDEMVMVNLHSHIEGTQEYVNLIKVAQSLYKSDMVGTENQVKWAKTLRENMVVCLARTLVTLQIRDIVEQRKHGNLDQKAAVAAATKRVRIVALQSQAAWYIENQKGDVQICLMLNAAIEATKKA